MTRLLTSSIQEHHHHHTISHRNNRHHTITPHDVMFVHTSYLVHVTPSPSQNTINIIPSLTDYYLPTRYGVRARLLHVRTHQPFQLIQTVLCNLSCFTLPAPRMRGACKVKWLKFQSTIRVTSQGFWAAREPPRIHRLTPSTLVKWLKFQGTT